MRGNDAWDVEFDLNSRKIREIAAPPAGTKPLRLREPDTMPLKQPVSAPLVA